MTRQQGQWWLLIVALICSAVPTAGLADPVASSPIVDLNDSLSVRWGDSPRDAAGRFAWLQPDATAPWLDLDTAAAQRPDDHDDIMWVRFEIPDGQWRQPAVYLPAVLTSFEVYADSTLIFDQGKFEPSHELRYSAVSSYIIPLPAGCSGTVISMRIYSPLNDYIGINTMHRSVLVGQQGDVVRFLFFENIDSLILGSLFFFAGLISLGVFLRRLRYRLWYLLSFAGLACNIGLFYILGDAIGSLLGVPPQLTYYGGYIAFAAFPVGLYAFLEQIVGEHRVLRRLWQFHLLYAVAVVPLDLIDVELRVQTGQFYSVAFAVGIAIAMVIVARAAAQGNRQARIFGVGYVMFAITGLHDILMGLGWIPMTHWMSHWGMLVLILHLAYILEQTYAENLRQLRILAHELQRKTDKLEEYSTTLEQRVEQRTHDLAEKNEQLVETMLELEETQAQMVMQDKMASLGNLVAGVAHEMNTPMGAMMGAADVEARCIAVLQQELDASTDIDELRASSRFQRARRSLLASNETLTTGGKRIAGILASLKSFARLDEATYQVVDLHEGIESSLMLLDHELKHRIEVVREFGALPRVGCNANQINQVFMNLLVNAAQAIDGNGVITIKTAAAGDEVIVSIADDGTGIAAADQQQIFDPGYTTKGVGVGTGLGLSICYQIMRDHGGRITVTSAPGQGSTFELRLPSA